MSAQYFQGVDTLGIVEAHVRQVLKLQDQDAEHMVKLYRQIRGELRDRLDRMPGGTFQAQHLRAVLAQVEGALRAMETQLQHHMREASLRAAREGATHVLEEMRTLSEHFQAQEGPDQQTYATAINLDVVRVADDTHSLLMRKYETSLKSYTEAVRMDVTHHLTRLAVQEESYGDVLREIGKYFQGEEWRLRRLIRTELHNVYNLSKMRGMGELKDTDFPNLKKALIHPMDHRTAQDSIELAIENPIVDIDEPFVQNFRSSPKAKPVRYVFMVPPDRPNDRAVVVPYREEWG